MKSLKDYLSLLFEVVVRRRASRVVGLGIFALVLLPALLVFPLLILFKRRKVDETRSEYIYPMF